MIKKNNYTINEWYFNDAELIKVYKNGAICYYKMVLGETPHQEPCFAVVNDITQYSDTEFIDVYDKATEKWYKLNNLDQYEEYGVYGEGRNITYYEGKLTIDNDYEYEWDGSEWVSLGEVTGSSIIIHSPEYLERTSSSSGYLPLGETFQLNTTIEMDFQMTQAKGNAIIGDYGTNDSNDWRLFLNYDTRVNNLLSYDFINTRAQYNTGNWAKRFNIRIGNYYVVDIDTGTRLINSTRKTSFTRPNQMYLFHMEGSQITNNTDYGHIYSVKIYQDGTLVKDYIPWTDGNGTYGMWDKVSNQSVTSVGQMTGSSVVHDIDVGDEPEYPKYYTEKDEPENNVVFTDMAEALAYQCPWVGMDATIDNTPYLFGDAYEWLTKYGLFEVSGEYMCYNGNKYEKMEEMVRNTDGTWSSQIPAVYEMGDLIEADSPDCYSRVPDGYTEVEWVGSTGNSAYVNTSLLVGNTVGDAFSIEGTISTEYQTGFGYLISNEQTVVPYPNFTWRWNGGTLKLDTAERITPDVFLDLTDNGDGTSAFTIYSEGVSLSCTTPVSLFAGLNGSSPWRYGKGKLYNELKITKNNVLVADYIPCQRDSDNRYGFYDLVTDTFKGSSNNNLLSGGNPV